VCNAARLKSFEEQLAGREREILALKEQLQSEVKAEAQRTAGIQAELAGVLGWTRSCCCCRYCCCCLLLLLLLLLHMLITWIHACCPVG
jgi:hypothetical protein